MLLVLSCAIFAVLPAAAQNFLSPTQIASVHSLTSSTSLPFPTQTLSSEDAATFLKQSSWGITKNSACLSLQLRIGHSILCCDQVM